MIPHGRERRTFDLEVSGLVLELIGTKAIKAGRTQASCGSAGLGWAWKITSSRKISHLTIWPVTSPHVRILDYILMVVSGWFLDLRYHARLRGRRRFAPEDRTREKINLGLT